MDARVPVPYGGGTIDIECAWIHFERRSAPLVVFLHDGLGSVSTWRGFPERVCEAAGWRGLVYSRPGYGRSTARAADERWPPTFMHEQARQLLPSLLASVGVDVEAEPPWLFGHSDGGSIALIFAASFPRHAAGLVVVAPHVFVEDETIASIEAARVAYASAGLRERLARHHLEPDSAFWGWSDAWLDPAFRSWNIEALLPEVRCPVLAVQGVDDEYGTPAQLERIARVVPHAEGRMLSACGHSVHRDQPEALTAATIEFLLRHSRGQP